jgi:hypothetical protein
VALNVGELPVDWAMAMAGPIVTAPIININASQHMRRWCRAASGLVIDRPRFEEPFNESGIVKGLMELRVHFI